MISIITVNYGHGDNILRLYDSLKKNAGVNFELIIIDNNSPEIDKEKIKTLKKYSNITLVFLPKNLGFGAGNEAGVKIAKGKIIALINPDIQVGTGCITKLLEAYEQEEKPGIFVPTLTNPDGTLQENERTFPTIAELLSRRTLGIENSGNSEPQEPNTVFPIPWAHGSFFLMSKDFFMNDLKGFDPRFFLFFEDTDLCRRTWELGRRVLKVPGARAIHGAERLSSGRNIWHMLGKSAFWIHLNSARKYFWKYRGKEVVEIF